MRRSRFVALAAVLAAVAVGAFASSASALGITPTPTGTDTIATSQGRLRMLNVATGQTLECNILLVLRYDPGVIPFVAPLTRIGSVNGGAAYDCAIGPTRVGVVMSGFPWTIAVDGNSTVANRLQTILGVQLRVAACPFAGNVGFVPNGAGNPVTALRTLMATLNGPMICANMTVAAGQLLNLSVPINQTFIP